MRRSLMLVVFLGGRNIAKTVRAPMMVAVSLVQPVVWLLLFSQTFRSLGSGPQLAHLGYHSYLSFLTPAMVVLSVLFTALQSGMATVTDISTGMMDKLTASPIPRWAVLGARLYADAVLMVVQTVIVLGIAAAMGASEHAGVDGIAIMGVSAVAFGVVWGCLSNLIALRTRNAELTMAVGFVLTLPVLFLSSAFFPLSLQPRWIRTAADVNPAAYVISAGQRLMNTGGAGTAELHMLAALAITAVALVPLTIRAFRTSAG